MSAQAQDYRQTSGQSDPKCVNIRTQTDIPFTINGCTVSFTSSGKGSDDSIKAVKEILLSAYRTKTAYR